MPTAKTPTNQTTAMYRKHHLHKRRLPQISPNQTTAIANINQPNVDQSNDDERKTFTNETTAQHHPSTPLATSPSLPVCLSLPLSFCLVRLRQPCPPQQARARTPSPAAASAHRHTGRRSLAIGAPRLCPSAGSLSGS